MLSCFRLLFFTKPAFWVHCNVSTTVQTSTPLTRTFLFHFSTPQIPVPTTLPASLPNATLRNYPPHLLKVLPTMTSIPCILLYKSLRCTQR
ncbi:hypothetical protein BGX38DRAFT_1188805 [Terfezia claveryi]|nr:hypothetical protein BGX38DRAFT_1188805 [Terfezia claveryi]